MADGVKLTFKGKDALLAKLRSLVPNVDKAMGEANQGSADEMATLARSFVAIGKTGKLKASIRVERGDRPGSHRVLAGGPSTTKEVRAGSGKPFDYALGVEFGTSQHTNGGMFKGSENPGARRQPFFWVAYRLMKKRIKARNTRAINKAIKAAKG